MAHAFTDEDKVEKEFNNNYFSFGVHKVQFLLAEAGTTENGKEYIEVSFCDPADGEKTDSARVWFSTENAANYSFNTLKQIAVHNAPEKAKEAARNAVDAVADTEELAALLNDKIMGGELWMTKYYDPKRTYENAKGVTKKSVNTNIYGYEPTLREDLMPAKADESGNAVTDAFPDATPATGDAAANIPDNWS